jgi:poly-gamma-glutamate capsule biosynthesis protein CapA/YwtB (metallophosphatase superfamily)
MSNASFVGAADLMIDETDPDFMLEHVANEMRGADITYVNLEGPMCDRGETNPALLGIASAIRSAPRVAPALRRAGVDVVSLANNHTMDYGVAGLEQTLKLLRDNGIPYCGAGRDLAEAREPVITQVNGVRVAFLSYTTVCPPSYAAAPGTHGAAYVRASTSYEANPRLFLQPGSPMAIRTVANREDLAGVQEEIAAAKAQADAVMVSWHWGVSERWGKVAEYQREMGRAAVDAGATAVLGHHAHMLLGVEHYRGCPIFYSLGNFAFDKSHPSFLPQTAFVKCDVGRDGNVSRLRLLPLLINARRQPVPAQGMDAHRIAWLLEDQSHGMNTRIACEGGEITLSPLA